jgi:hypothetical protein
MEFGFGVQEDSIVFSGDGVDTVFSVEIFGENSVFCVGFVSDEYV